MIVICRLLLTLMDLFGLADSGLAWRISDIMDNAVDRKQRKF